MTDLEELVEKEVKNLKSRDDVKAVAVVGSYARDPEDEHNDIDLLAVVEGDWRRRETEIVDGVVVERFYNSKEWLTEDITGDAWYKSYHWFTNADVRHDPENTFDELKEKVENEKEARLGFTEEDKEELLYSIWDKKQDLDTNDVGQKRYLLNEFFNYLVFQHYLMKEEVPVKPNYRVKNLKNFDGYMYKLAQDFLTSSSTHEKEKKLEKMVDHVTRNLGEPGPEWETEKEHLEE